VLFVIVDTLRADALPAYGGEKLETPALDRLAAEGTVLRAFAQASWTKPSIASILTSLYPSSHGAVHKPSRLPDSVDTLAEIVSAFGYTAGGIVTNINLAPSFNFQQGFGEYHYLVPDYLFGVADSTSRLLLYEIARRIEARISGGVRPGQAYQPADRVNARALEWLDRHGQERFFLLLHYMEPHDPYFAHPDDGRAIARATTPHPDPEQRDEMLRRYRGEIESLDRHLGALFEELEARGLWNDTLVVLTSDHGEEFLDHGGFWHGLTLYDEQIAIPLIFRWPDGPRPAAARWDLQVRSIDIAPTLLAYLGAPIPPGMQGDDLLAEPPRERAVFAEEDHEGNLLTAVRGAGWKLIRANPNNPRGLAELELYRLSEDPAEQHNHAGDEAARVRRLLADLDALERMADAQARRGEVADIDRRECERLRALGYVDECH
jgi:arylsulfatase A-like enzyme